MTNNAPQMAAWDIHHYVPTGDPLSPVDALEAWLAERGVYNPQFFISEWGACTPERVAEMKTAFDNDERVLKHFFYDQFAATWDGDGRCTMLFEEGSEPLRLSPLGRAFAEEGR